MTVQEENIADSLGVSFEKLIEKNVQNRNSQYGVFFETLLTGSLVSWDFNGVLAKVELVNGRLQASLKPITSANYTNPLTSAQFPTLRSDQKILAVEMFAWLEAEISANY